MPASPASVRLLAALLLSGLAVAACVPTAAPSGARAPGATRPSLAFLRSTLRRWPASDSPGRLAVTDPARGRVAVYDSALVALVLVRAGDRDAAASVLLGLAALQREDGALPFSFTLPAPDPAVRYERAGAIAWAGYAAAEYLDADSGGPARGEVTRFAHRAAHYLLSHQVTDDNDRRAGLVLGGTGTFRYEAREGRIREVFEAGDVPWAAVEHNIDAYFFLRALARATGTPAYAEASARIARALTARAWWPAAGQFAEGLAPDGPDASEALDCASWGSVLLAATGDMARAAVAFATADRRYGSRDPDSGARGHKPYGASPVVPDREVARRVAPALAGRSWAELALVWPEGSAGVALAAWRSGRSERARAIVDELELLRAPDGSLPTATMDVPFVFDRSPSIAATAWVDLVRFELGRPLDRPTLWAP